MAMLHSKKNTSTFELNFLNFKRGKKARNLLSVQSYKMDYSLYPPNWQDIRQRILERAGHQCENCGIPDRVHAVYLADDGYDLFEEADAEHARFYGLKVVRIVLTVAHADQDRQNNADENLFAWCQRCHFAYDRPFNVAKSCYTKRYGRDKKQLRIPFQLPIPFSKP